METNLKIGLILLLIILAGIIYLVFPVFFSMSEKNKFIDIAKQTDEIKDYLELYPNAYVTAAEDCRLTPIDSDECPWMIVFYPTADYAISSHAEEWVDKAYVRIYPNGTIKEAMCFPCNTE